MTPILEDTLEPPTMAQKGFLGSETAHPTDQIGAVFYVAHLVSDAIRVNSKHHDDGELTEGTEPEGVPDCSGPPGGNNPEWWMIGMVARWL